MRILSYKISNTDDIIENVQNNDHILIIYKDNTYYYMWFGNINKTFLVSLLIRQNQKIKCKTI